MEADGVPEQLQTNDMEPLLSFCPSFNSYSSDQCAQIAADVANERPRASSSSSDFEFAFEKAEEISHDACEFRQIFPVFNRDILFGDNHDHPKDDGKRDLSTILLPLKKLFDEDPSSSCSSSEVDELERVPEGTYCVWRPKSVKLASPSLDAIDDAEARCKKSNSTGSASKRWKLRDLLLLRRSNSDGKGSSFVFLTPKSTARDHLKETEDSKERRNSGEAGKGKAKGAAAAAGEKAASAHEVFYVQNRASKEVDKRKSYLPYRKDLVGFFASVNGAGAGKAFPPF
ncbi:hypothetical protein RHSIM_Rhsim10G0021000 [Rhododendron simsii]|uniref:Uncharacterized protein n=1 Tax=Rhododendron simsii TaxID=118357 RepID=A0A834LD08_RHOSS|nr:hypothetical protein RHSIM_Rhsim10G0021000 [Rhododendron simsii]